MSDYYTDSLDGAVAAASDAARAANAAIRGQAGPARDAANSAADAAASAATSAQAAQDAANLVNAPAGTAIDAHLGGDSTTVVPDIATLKTDVAGKAPLPGTGRNPLTGWFHVDGFGAKGDGTTDDTAAIQAAIDAADTAGGGRVYLRKGTYKTTGLLLPSKVALVGDSAGGQVGNSTKLSYAGAAGGTLLGPKNRAADTINWKIEGIDFDGGALAGIVVEFYRVSYSRMQDCAIYGGQAATGVGVLFDANINNQCYFNVVDNVKVDGLSTGVRFQRGANANRWQGGKIGNGATGMEFLTASSGNIVVATDLEEATAKHVYLDAAANVFIGLHMEIAPIGYDITANGSGTRRIATTFASTVTTYVNDQAALGGGIDEVTSDTYGLQLGTSKVHSRTLSTSTQFSIDPLPFNSTASVLLNWMRNVNTTGLKQINIYRGDGTGTRAFLLDFGTATLSVGDVGLGGGVGGLGIASVTTAPTSNPSGGGFLYVQGGYLKHKGSNGVLFDTTQRTVTGSRGGNAALASLLTALAQTGLIIDSTTA